VSQSSILYNILLTFVIASPYNGIENVLIGLEKEAKFSLHNHSEKQKELLFMEHQ